MDILRDGQLLSKSLVLNEFFSFCVMICIIYSDRGFVLQWNCRLLPFSYDVVVQPGYSAMESIVEGGYFLLVASAVGRALKMEKVD